MAERVGRRQIELLRSFGKRFGFGILGRLLGRRSRRRRRWQLERASERAARQMDRLSAVDKRKALCSNKSASGLHLLIKRRAECPNWINILPSRSATATAAATGLALALALAFASSFEFAFGCASLRLRLRLLSFTFSRRPLSTAICLAGATSGLGSRVAYVCAAKEAAAGGARPAAAQAHLWRASGRRRRRTCCARPAAAAAEIMSARTQLEGRADTDFGHWPPAPYGRRCGSCRCVGAAPQTQLGCGTRQVSIVSAPSLGRPIS